MGSKGSSPKTTQQTQTTTPSPYIGGAGQAAIQGAEYAAGQPFQMPVAPLAPFSPYQNQAMAGVGQAVGMAQPYFGAGAGYLAGSAAPVTGQDVAGYYNPMASSVMAGMQDIFGQQMKQATGRAVQQAGGVGADRIAVAQANLAKQQGLAAGQTMAGLYYPALQAAQQQKQMMAGAGYGMGQMGPAAQAAQLQSLQAQMGAGGMQQQLAQQYMNNLYANRLAEMGYPMQTAQYLAGITGGLAPAMGGTTQGQTQTWQPQPSALSQVLGLGTSLLGLGMAPFTGGASLFGSLGGMMGGGTGKGATYGAPSGSWGSYGGVPYPTFRRGGKVGFAPAHMKGGGSPPPMAPPPAPIYSPKPIGQSAVGSQAIPYGGVSTEEALSEASPFFEWYGGIPDVSRAQISRMTTPAAQRQAFLAQPQAPMGATSSSAGFSMADLLSGKYQRDLLAKYGISLPGGEGGVGASPFAYTQMAGNTNPGYIYARGGAVDPFSAGEGFQEGGAPWGLDEFPFTPTDTPSPATDFGGYATQQEQEAAQSGIESARRRTEADIIPPQPMGADPSLDPTTAIPPQPMGGDPSLDPTAAIPPQPMGVDPSLDPAAAIPPPSPAYAAEPPLEAGYPPQPQPVTDIPMPMERPAEAALSDKAAPLPAVYKGMHEILSQRYGPKVAAAMLGNLGVESPTLNPAESHDQGTGIGIAGWRLDRKEALFDFAESQGRDPMDRRTQLDFLNHEIETNPEYTDMVKRMQAAPNAAVAARIFRTEFERPAGTTQGRPLGLDQAQRLALKFESGDYSGVGAGRAPGETTTISARGPMGAGRVEDYMMPRERAPYPDALRRDWGQNLARSPWMSLIKAGAAMAQTPGPIGSVIGKGIETGVGALEGQRKELRSEEDINLKADKLWQEAKQHLDKYTKMTPYEQARVEQERYQWQPGMGIDPDTGTKVAGAWRLPTRSGEQPTFIPGAQITGKGGTRETALERNINMLVQKHIAPNEEEAFKILHHSLQDQATFQRLVQNEQKFLADRPENAGKDSKTIRAMAEENIRQAQQDARMRAPLIAPAPGEPTGTRENPIPYVKGMKTEKGKFYQVPGEPLPRPGTGG